MYDIFIRQDDDPTWSDGLFEQLRARGAHVAAGPDVQACRVLICRGPCGDVPGAAILDVRAASWLPPTVATGDCDDRIIDCALSLLELGYPERLADEAHIARAIVDVNRFVSEHIDEDPLVIIAESIECAVDRGAPIHNAGSPLGCAMVYEATIEALLAKVNPDPEQTPLVDAILDELRLIDEVPEEDAAARSWALRNAFDRVLLAYHTAQAMQAMDLLFESLQNAGRTLTPSLLFDVVGLAIARGAPVFNAGGHAGCARVYLRTARGILDLLETDVSDASQSEQLAKDMLGTLTDGADDRLAEESTELAWDLRNAFDAIVEVAAEERDWKHDA